MRADCGLVLYALGKGHITREQAKGQLIALGLPPKTANAIVVRKTAKEPTT
jgi:hypothetical protein